MPLDCGAAIASRRSYGTLLTCGTSPRVLIFPSQEARLPPLKQAQPTASKRKGATPDGVTKKKGPGRPKKETAKKVAAAATKKAPAKAKPAAKKTAANAKPVAKKAAAKSKPVAKKAAAEAKPVTKKAAAKAPTVKKKAKKVAKKTTAKKGQGAEEERESMGRTVGEVVGQGLDTAVSAVASIIVGAPLHL